MFGLGSEGIVALAVLLLVLFLPAMIGEFIASGKGRSALGWFLLCGIFPPAIFVIMLLKPGGEVDGKYKKCDACQEIIKWQATVCRYCQTRLNDQAQADA